MILNVRVVGGLQMLDTGEADDKLVAVVLLNSFGKLTPFGDSNRLMNWMLAGK